MNNIQNYGSINVNSNYGKVNKSPNFKAWVHLDGAKDFITKQRTNDYKQIFAKNNDSDFLSFTLEYIKDTLKNALKLKNLSKHSEYYDGVIDKTGNLGIRPFGSSKVYYPPFKVEGSNNNHSIYGTLTQGGAKQGEDPILSCCIPDEVATKLSETLSANGLYSGENTVAVFEVLENSMKDSVKEIKDMASKLL